MRSRAAVLNCISRFVLVCVFLLPCSCSQTNTLRRPILPQATVDAFVSLNAHTQRHSDVNAYFTVLDKLSMEEGYVLDFIYVSDFYGGGPVIYARPVDQPPLASLEDLLAAAKDPHATTDKAYSRDFLQHIRIQDGAGGYFQFVVLALMAGQFDLQWHGDYYDVTLVCNGAGLTRTLAATNDFLSRYTSDSRVVPDTVRQAAATIDFAPTVEFSEDRVTVRVVTFTKWGGFAEEMFTISRHFPHQILDHAEKWLVQYDCGIWF